MTDKTHVVGLYFADGSLFGHWDESTMTAKLKQEVEAVVDKRISARADLVSCRRLLNRSRRHRQAASQKETGSSGTHTGSPHS
jgi:hypothetical protein